MSDEDTHKKKVNHMKRKILAHSAYKVFPLCFRYPHIQFRTVKFHYVHKSVPYYCKSVERIMLQGVQRSLKFYHLETIFNRISFQLRFQIRDLLYILYS